MDEQSSSSSYYSPSSTSSNFECKICEKDGHGLHFGVQTCRACAAFFRRTTALNRKYRCKNRSGKCGVEERMLCKFCRFKKCVELKMSPERIRDNQVHETRISLPSEKVGRNKFETQVEYCVMHPQKNVPAILVDISAIVRRSKNILDTYELQEELKNLNPLERMVYSLKQLRLKQNWNPEFFTNVKFHDLFFMWEVKMNHTAEWLMHCDEFRHLPSHEKLAFFKIVWAIWRRIERYTMTAEIFGQQCYDEKILLFSDELATRCGDFQVNYSAISNEDDIRVKKVFEADTFSLFDVIVKPYLSLKLSTTEVTYILCQICWNYASRRLQGQTLAAAEIFLENIGNNLHEYYEKKNGESGRYAVRIVKMMSIVNEMLNFQLRRETTMDMAILFDFLSIIFTEPEFFCV